MRRKVVLKVTRFRQDPNLCALATCSSMANFFNPQIKYKDVKKTVPSSYSKNGMVTPEQGLLLNKLGIKRVAVVTADTDYFDFTWQNHRLKWKIEKLKKLAAYSRRKINPEHDVEYIEKYIEFLQNEGCDNDIIIDWYFPKWIKHSIRKGMPVAASINYTSFYKMSKERPSGLLDDIKGETVEHAFVIRGFDDECIYVVDSNGKRTKEYNGYYKIKWEDFLVNIGSGDILLVNDAA